MAKTAKRSKPKAAARKTAVCTTRTEEEITRGLTEAAPRPARQRSEEEITVGLTELALAAGNSEEAARQLELKGYDIPARTLREWRNNGKAERYHQIRNDLAPKIHDRIAYLFEDSVIQAAQAKAETIEHYRAHLHEQKPAEAAASARNLGVIQGIDSEKTLLFRNRPTQIVEQRAPDQILKQLAARYGTAIDVEHEEIQDAEQVGPDASAERTATSPDLAEQRAQS